MRKILFTICGRAGSKGVQNKNLRSLRGIPIVYYTLGAIKLYMQTHPEDKVVTCLNTDSSNLIEQVRQQNLVDNVELVERKASLAGDIVPKVAVIQDTYLQMKEKHGGFDHVIDLDITSPMRRTGDIEAVINEIEINSKYDLVFSVVHSRRSPYFNMVEKKIDGSYRKICQSDYTARQQAPECYELNASIYNYRSTFLDKEINKTILEYDCGIIIMPDYLVLDIDSENDFRMMEVLMEFYNEEDGEINKLLKQF